MTYGPRFSSGISRGLLLFLLLIGSGTVPGCQEERTTSPPEVTHPRILSPSTRGVRALRLMGLEDILMTEARISDPPTLVLTEPQAADSGAPTGGLEVATGVPTLEIAPHDLEDAYVLYRTIARFVADPTLGRVAMRQIQAPLLARAALQLGRPRPCIAVVTSLEPLVLAGGHSFETDVVQISGAESATHPGEAWRRPVSSNALAEMSVDLVIVLESATGSLRALDRLADRVSPTPVRRAAFDADALWLGEAAGTESILAKWSTLVEEARATPRDAPNCRLDPRQRDGSA